MTSHVAKDEPELDHFPGAGTSVVIFGACLAGNCHGPEIGQPK